MPVGDAGVAGPCPAALDGSLPIGDHPADPPRRRGARRPRDDRGPAAPGPGPPPGPGTPPTWDDHRGAAVPRTGRLMPG